MAHHQGTIFPDMPHSHYIYVVHVSFKTKAKKTNKIKQNKKQKTKTKKQTNKKRSNNFICISEVLILGAFLYAMEKLYTV